MFSSQKKHQNIAEYILYMWQVEDFVRSCNFDIELIDQAAISSYNVSDEEKRSIRNWYQEIINEMDIAQIREVGHLEELNEILVELSFLHNSLINIFQDNHYVTLFNEAKEIIDELKKKSGKNSRGDVESCLIGLYGIIVLKMQKKKITDETLAAVKVIGSLISYLSDQYRSMKEGTLQLSKVKSN